MANKIKFNSTVTVVTNKTAYLLNDCFYPSDNGDKKFTGVAIPSGKTVNILIKDVKSFNDHDKGWEII